MRAFSLVDGRITSILRMTAAASLLSGLLSSVAAAAEPTAAGAGKTTIPRLPVEAQPTTAELESWRQGILKTPRPKTGCYTATYPETQWREIPCKTPSRKLYPPRQGQAIQSDIVGGAGPDFSAVVTGHITEAEGSFDQVTSVTSECAVQCPNQICPLNPSCTGQPANQYSLQLNSKPFSTVACQNSPHKNAPPPHTCQGWQQFVYSPAGGGTIQYWLLSYGPAGTSCPAPQGASCLPGYSSTDGWCPFSFTTGPTAGDVYCVVNAVNATPALGEPITELGQLKVTGAAAGVSGPDDAITVTSGPTMNTASGNNYFPDLGSQWQEAEFNVFGDGNGDQAVFNSGATVVVRTGVTSGTMNGPGCDMTSFTGESNNLTLGNVPPTNVQLVPSPGTLKMPALVFTENSLGLGGAPATCADATSVGDTHVTTFDGVYYDFQASGDFVLAETGPDFIVQARQALANTDPGWIKNATINKAVATQMGKTRVAVYVDPPRLVIDGQATHLANGKTLSLPTDVQVSLHGNLYVIIGPNGERVSASLNNNNINTWLDVTVGLGHTPSPDARGLLGNPGGNGHELKTASGTVLNAPVAFTDLYQSYADSWRVQPNQALLEPDPTIKPGIPDKPFYAADLDAAQSAQARATCTAAGVTQPALLEACMLDTAVLGDATPAKVFVAARIPVHLIKPEVIAPK